MEARESRSIRSSTKPRDQPRDLIQMLGIMLWQRPGRAEAGILVTQGRNVAGNNRTAPFESVRTSLASNHLMVNPDEQALGEWVQLAADPSHAGTAGIA